MPVAVLPVAMGTCCRVPLPRCPAPRNTTCPPYWLFPMRKPHSKQETPITKYLNIFLSLSGMLEIFRLNAGVERKKTQGRKANRRRISLCKHHPLSSILNWHASVYKWHYSGGVWSLKTECLRVHFVNIRYLQKCNDFNMYK